MNIGFGDLGKACVVGMPCWDIQHKRPMPPPRQPKKPTVPSVLGPIAGMITPGNTPTCYNKKGKEVDCKWVNKYPWFKAPAGGSIAWPAGSLSGLGCACNGAMAALGDLGAEAFDYKGADCSTLGQRVDRLKANMSANPKRAAQAKYKTNLTNFTTEYNNRCGGAVSTDLNTTVAGSGPNPFTSAYAPSGISSAINPLAATLLTQLNPNAQFAMSAQQQAALAQAQLDAQPFYTKPWFKVAAVVGAVGVGFGLFKMSRRKKH